jgi:predicted acetyltransferase
MTPKLSNSCILAPSSSQYRQIGWKYKTTSFFGVKLLKCSFRKKNQLKKYPEKDIVLKRKKKKKKKKKEEEEERWGSSAPNLTSDSLRGFRP